LLVSFNAVFSHSFIVLSTFMMYVYGLLKFKPFTFLNSHCLFLIIKIKLDLL